MMKRRTSPPSQVREIAIRSGSCGIEFPRIWIQGRIKVDIRIWVHDESACGDDFAVDVDPRADIPPHRNMRLRYAERFMDEHIKDRCLVFPRGEGDRG